MGRFRRIQLWPKDLPFDVRQTSLVTLLVQDYA